MLVESVVKATVELQGFRVRSVTGDTSGLVVNWAHTDVTRPAVAIAESLRGIANGASGGPPTRGLHRCVVSPGWCVPTNRISSTVSACPSTTAPSRV